LSPYKNMLKKDLILFPHRIAPEKQLDIFKDLEKCLPQYKFVVCQEQNLSKDEYHKLLGEAKMVFSANLQETLGIGMYEGAIVGAIPLVPDRLSYSEMYFETFKYPSEWTETFKSYEEYKLALCFTIIDHMTFYSTRIHRLEDQKENLREYFFSAERLVELLNEYK